ncbi:MAG TPA: PP2C family serine/threonine-protein phosphatase [Acidimicrobiales bacterium]|nr:PP2C family serine/threonine-protein phosphatase [Acidimicrobiales bacterium]
MTRWRHAAATDMGLVRATNQDALYADDSLAIIADGMGGHAAGEVAAAISIDLVRERFHEHQSVEALVDSIQEANTVVVTDARENPEHFGMGTTVIAVGITYDLNGVGTPTLVHVGDSRAYQLRDGALRQLTEDHSVAEEWVRMGRLTPQEAATHPRRHQLTRGVGVEDTVAIDVMSIQAAPGDRILLCSDGLSNELDSDTIARLASAPNGLEFAVESLVSAAKVAGGHDNISVILLEFDEVNVPASPMRRTMSSTPPEATTASSEGTRRRRRIVTWRLFAALVLFIAVGVGAVGVIHWYAYSTYYVGIFGSGPDASVAVFHGQPAGVLWYKPQVLVEYDNYPIKYLSVADRRELYATVNQPTAKEAKIFAKCMIDRSMLATTTTTTTTTTTPGGATTTTSRSGATTTTSGFATTTTTAPSGCS